MLIAFRDLDVHRLRVVAHGIVFSIAVLAFVILGSYRNTLQQEYSLWEIDHLVVQESHSIAEFYGSRISPEVGALLEQNGIQDAVPEVHTIVGTNVQDAVLLKGVDLEGYRGLDPFTLVEGRALQPGDPPRLAMVGTRLAERFGVTVGEPIRLRGRRFQVVGIFETGSYTENEAWVPIAGAQDLLGWGQDISLYVVPDNGLLTSGEQLTEGVSVVRRGELSSDVPESWSSLLGLMSMVTLAIGLAAALALSAMLWRMSWQRRWQFAVLRSIGFNRMSMLCYLAIQGCMVAFAGGLVGVVGAVLIMRLAHVNLGGLSLQPQLEALQLINTALWLSLLTLTSVIVPAFALGRRRVSELLVTS
jgi:ABC-type lipoprotein release transport system permease subunit